MKILQIINTAYRATIEEQDDTIIWLTHAMAGAGGDFDVVLCGNAVNYTAKHQNAEGLAFGDWRQTQPPRIARDIAGLIAKDVNVYVVAEDADDMRLDNSELIDGTRRITRSELADLLEEYDQIWRW